MNIESINIFDFDGTLTTETWPKFWVWVKKFGYNGENISKSTKDYIDYLNELLTDNNIGITYKEQITKDNLKELEKDYTIMSLVKMENNEYSEEELGNYIDSILTE